MEQGGGMMTVATAAATAVAKAVTVLKCITCHLRCGLFVAEHKFWRRWCCYKYGAHTANRP